MWLLHTRTLQLERFREEAAPRYAILSHTWAKKEEQFFQALHKRRDTTESPSGDLISCYGWAKIEGACRLSRKRCLDYVWIDSCCIDHSSSTELQEAINSMFRWYEDASICFVYLEDVSEGENQSAMRSSFRECRWFTRGWTLQELLAPREIQFLDKSWKEMRWDDDLCDIIAEVTGIDSRYLLGESGRGAFERISGASISERMSWAANRRTSRSEDMAYCLLGIFDVNMPMLYGEGGAKAFQRLQEEIMKTNDDSSLLCWGYMEYRDDAGYDRSSLLARHPARFRNCRNIQRYRFQGNAVPSFSMVQRGLQITLPVIKDMYNRHLIYGILDCGPGDTLHQGLKGRECFLAMPLVSTHACDASWAPEGPQRDEYLRLAWCTPLLVSTEFLKLATSRNIVIRRPSKTPEHLRVLPWGLSRPLSTYSLFAIRGTYPPQPIDFPFRSFLGLCNLKGPIVLPMMFGRKADMFRVEHSETCQTMIHIQIMASHLLVIFDYSVLTVGYHKLTCRAFKLPADFPFESMRHLASTQDFTSLDELECNRDGSHSKFLLSDIDRVLNITIRELQDKTIPTQLYFSKSVPST